MEPGNSFGNQKMSDGREMFENLENSFGGKTNTRLK
jgi:hypothetical protein